MHEDHAEAVQRVSDADREAAAARLRTAFEEGRLDQDEHAGRVDAALGARTRGELDTVLADLAATGEGRTDGGPGPQDRQEASSQEVAEREGSRLSPLAVWGIFTAVAFLIWAVPALFMGYLVGVLGWALFCAFWGIPALAVTVSRRRRRRG